MRKSLKAVLADCLQELEANGGDVDACLRLHPGRADELRPYLTLRASLRGVASTTAAGDLSAGRHALLRTASELQLGTEGVKPTMWTNPVFRFAGVAAAAVLLLGLGTLGAAAATGGDGGLVDDVLTTLHVRGPDDHANPNASDRCYNAEEGRGNASPNAENGDSHAAPRAAEGAVGEAGDDAGDRCENAAATEGEGAANAGERCANAGQGLDNANPNAENGISHASERADDGAVDGQPADDANANALNGCEDAADDGETGDASETTE